MLRSRPHSRHSLRSEVHQHLAAPDDRFAGKAAFYPSERKSADLNSGKCAATNARINGISTGLRSSKIFNGTSTRQCPFRVAGRTAWEDRINTSCLCLLEAGIDQCFNLTLGQRFACCAPCQNQKNRKKQLAHYTTVMTKREQIGVYIPCARQSTGKLPPTIGRTRLFSVAPQFASVRSCCSIRHLGLIADLGRVQHHNYQHNLLR